MRPRPRFRRPPRLRPPAGTRLPAFAHSIRFRLTVMYSTLLFVLTALVLGGIYGAVAARTDAEPITETARADKIYRFPDGSTTKLGEVEVVKVQQVERAVNYETQQALQHYSLLMLAGLFVASLGIGWVLSGRALKPVRAIARTAAEIQATDLSRRIRLTGPKDELRYLADTIDSMLDRLDAAFAAQRQLIDDASHELRSPLAIIRANLDTVLIAPDAEDADRRRAVQVVDRATTRMTRLVEDLLATARRSAPAFHDTDVDLAVVAREAAEEFDSLAASRRLTIDRELRRGLTLIGDHDALRRAAGNLLSNAVRLAPAGSRITVAADRAGGWQWLAVKDAGPGIGRDEQDRVFDRFWRGPEARRSPDRRTGLGLAIVRHIVEAHGGHVRLFSAPDVGSTFVLWFPVAGGNGGAPQAPPETDPLAERTGPVPPVRAGARPPGDPSSR
ncbi:HAMP domain-containing sensor histidine kinase [Actinomadura viridis]|uniref:histidine kinase n=1 Tax=Actinomadura viridis TaxID=58110 RepID=A0A931DP66_9ACTN|nr:HAMP domain-containing sensor histidine kinase [Actinomadura viridis]MBG6090750.1 signal transduction histidine kinase [Actinomadura viridis]